MILSLAMRLLRVGTRVEQDRTFRWRRAGARPPGGGAWAGHAAVGCESMTSVVFPASAGVIRDPTDVTTVSSCVPRALRG